MTEDKKRTAPAATGNGPSNLDGHTRIIAPNSLEAQAMEAIAKKQEENDRKAMRDIARGFSDQDWRNVLSVVPARVLADELADRATRGVRIARKMAEVYEEETKEWR